MRPSVLLGLAGSATALIGHGITMYKPECAFSCRAVIASNLLSCSSHDHEGGAHSHGGPQPTTPECRAGDDAFLTTLAACIDKMCGPFKVPEWKLEKYWAEKVTGERGVLPKWTYAEAVQNVKTIGTEIKSKEMLNSTRAIGQEAWQGEKQAMEAFEYQETMHARFGLIILIAGFALPIIASLLRFVPFLGSFIEKIKPYAVTPSAVGTYSVRPLPGSIGNAPTIGQGIYVAIFFALNLVLSIVTIGAYPSGENAWFETHYQEILAYASCRTGVFAFAILPLLILFGGRNNILLFITNWSHSTFMLLHRWVARVFAIQVILHSILELVLYVAKGTHSVEVKKAYWIWGIVATLTTSIMVVISTLWFRKRSYELFLIVHIILAIFTIVGSWYHVELLFSKKWGYELWLYAAIAVWVFDRLIRVARMGYAGFNKAVVTDITPEIVRVDVPGVRWNVRPGQHAYLYFPGFTWHAIQNHPFSIAPLQVFAPHHNAPTSLNRSASDSEGDIEKSGSRVTNSKIITARHSRDGNNKHAYSGVRCYIRKAKGVTSKLVPHQSLTVLLDGPYHNSSSSEILSCDRVILIGGGIGISGLCGYIGTHTNLKLYWGCREADAAFAEELADVFDKVPEREIRIGKRLVAEEIITAELGWERLGVVVCGPGALCDNVRAAVVSAGRLNKAAIQLEVDAFSW